MWHPLRAQGKWMPCEDEALRGSVNVLQSSLRMLTVALSAVEQFGQQWEKVSNYVGRTGQDCRDRYRNHLEEKGVRNSG